MDVVTLLLWHEIAHVRSAAISYTDDLYACMKSTVPEHSNLHMIMTSFIGVSVKPGLWTGLTKTAVYIQTANATKATTAFLQLCLKLLPRPVDASSLRFLQGQRSRACLISKNELQLWL